MFVEISVNDFEIRWSEIQYGSRQVVMKNRGICHKLLIMILISSPITTLASDNADTLFAAEKWSAAADAYEVRVAESPGDTTAWIRLAVSARQSERFELALQALQIAEEQGIGAVQIGVERIRIDILNGETDAAIVGLAELVENGFTAVAFIRNDPILGRLAGNEAFDELTDNLEKSAYPCEHDPAFAEFDFWIGEWDVHGAAGQYAGSNVITREQRGCYLSEKWTNATGGGGDSINYVDKITGEWVQVWNDASGSQINIRGGLTDDGMLLVGTIHTVATNTTKPFRGLWTPLPDGRVRQYFEHSDDGGKTWTSWFEGFYTRKTD
jgi:hypothetical protein